MNYNAIFKIDRGYQEKCYTWYITHAYYVRGNPSILKADHYDEK